MKLQWQHFNTIRYPWHTTDDFGNIVNLNRPGYRGGINPQTDAYAYFFFLSHLSSFNDWETEAHLNII